MKRLIALFAAVLMMVSVFAACSQPGDANTSTGTASTTPSSTTPSSTTPEPVTIKWVGAGWQANAKADTLISRYKEKNPNVNIEYTELNNLVDTKFFQLYDTMIASGEQVDLVYLGLTDILVRAMNGAMQPVTQYIKDSGDDFPADFGDLFYQMLTVDGETYGIPYGSNTFKVFYNKEMFAEKGITIPDNWTWADFKDIAVKLNDPANNFYGCFLPITWWELTYAPAETAGWKMVYEKDGKVVAGFDDPLFKQNMELIYDLSMESKVMPDLAKAKAEKLNRRVALASKQTAMTVDGYYTFVYLQGYQFDDPGKPLDFTIGVAELPKWDASSSNDVGHSTPVGAFTLPKTATAGIEAYKFARFVCTDNFDLIGGIPAYTKADLTKIAANLNSYTDKAGTKHENIYDITSIADALAVNKTSHLAAFNHDPSLYAKYVGILNQLYSEQYELYFTGQMSIDDFVSTMQTRATEEIAKVQ